MFDRVDSDCRMAPRPLHIPVYPVLAACYVPFCHPRLVHPNDIVHHRYATVRNLLIAFIHKMLKIACAVYSHSVPSTTYYVSSSSHCARRLLYISHRLVLVCALYVGLPCYISDITCGLICGVSGIRTTVRCLHDDGSFLPTPVLHAASQLHSGLVQYTGTHFPAAVVYACRIVSPTLFAATYEYQHKVCVVYYTLLVHQSGRSGSNDSCV